MRGIQKLADDRIGGVKLLVTNNTPEGQKLLMLQRSVNCDRMPGKWLLPGGGIDPGEDMEEALKRELLEELNLRVRRNAQLNKLPFNYVLPAAYTSFGRDHPCHFYQADRQALKGRLKNMEPNKTTSIDWLPLTAETIEKQPLEMSARAGLEQYLKTADYPIDLAADKDYRAIAKLIKQELGTNWQPKALAKFIQERNAKLYALKDKNRVIGTGLSVPKSVAENPYNYLGSIAIDSNYQGKGLGRQLTQHLIDQSELPMELDISNDNVRSQNLCRSFGFQSQHQN